jgi:phage-related protein
MSKAFIREIYYYKTYYLSFFEGLPQDVKTKFNWTLQLIATLRMVPEKYFKHITGSKGLYEVRLEYGSDIYRVFCCFDEGLLIILLNGFKKTSQKTPLPEITKAEKLKEAYFNEKDK